jgi:hypothetical protein
VAVSGGYAYVAAGPAGLVTLDVSDPTQPDALGGTHTGGFALGATVSGAILYLADGDLGLRVFDLSDPAEPKELSHLGDLGYAHSVTADGDIAYVSAGTVHVIDVSDPRNPRRLGGNSATAASAVALQGEFLFASSRWNGLAVLDRYRPLVELHAAAPDGAGRFKLTVSGPQGAAITIQRSTDLTGWEDWLTVTAGAAPSEVEDPDTSSHPERYYRPAPEGQGALPPGH